MSLTVLGYDDDAVLIDSGGAYLQDAVVLDASGIVVDTLKYPLIATITIDKPYGAALKVSQVFQKTLLIED